MTAILEDAKELKVTTWGTLNTATSPAKLPDGQSPNNQNVWMDEKPGSIVTANGYKKLGTIPSGNPPTLLLNFFKTSDGSAQLIVSDNSTVWHTTDYVNFTSIKTGLSGFFQLRGKVIRDKVWLTNGSDAVMTWDGTTLTTLDGSGITPNVPKGKYIEYHDERVWLYGISADLSSCRFSELSDTGGTEIAPDNASAWPVDNELQISEGDADQGTGIFLYRGYLYCSKQFSIWRIVGYDQYTYTRVKTRSSTGTRFQESIQIKDDLVHFIGVDGFYQFDGENSKRISDIIDPASPAEGVFAFRNLQQPLLNSKFWNMSVTADLSAGTVPANIDVSNDAIDLIPADDSQANFNAGTKSDTTADDNPGSLQLALVTSGGTTDNVAPGKTPSLNLSSGGAIIGSAPDINDNSEAEACGFRNSGDHIAFDWQVLFGSSIPVGSVAIKKFYFERSNSAMFVDSAKLQYTTDGTNWVDVPGGAVTLPASALDGSRTELYDIPGHVGGFFVPETDVTVNFGTVSCVGLRFFMQANAGIYVIKELQIFRADFKSTGTFTSKSIDYVSVPASFGKLSALITTNGETYQFSTQSSDDNSTWDAAVNVANDAAIGSTLRRYLRWKVTLNSSNGLNSPVIDKVYVGGTYLSPIHDTGGNILQWGALQVDESAAGQTINVYYRAATTSGGVSAAAWTAIVPGAAPNTAITNSFIQIRVELSTADANFAPSVASFTVNWVLSSASGASVLQNVASFIWLNRYWLAAATLGASSNDVVIVLGKSTFGSPWHKKDFRFLSFCRFQDIFIAGSSTDGTLYHLEYGFSKDGAAMDSFYETRDFQEDGFILKGREALIHTDRSGPYDLSFGWSVDGGLNYTEKTIDLTQDSGKKLGMVSRQNIAFMSETVRFRFRINGADQPFSVDELHCYYRPSPSRGTVSGN